MARPVNSYIVTSWIIVNSLTPYSLRIATVLGSRAKLLNEKQRYTSYRTIVFVRELDIHSTRTIVRPQMIFYGIIRGGNCPFQKRHDAVSNCFTHLTVFHWIPIRLWIVKTFYFSHLYYFMLFVTTFDHIIQSFKMYKKIQIQFSASAKQWNPSINHLVQIKSSLIICRRQEGFSPHNSIIEYH